jgi:hypothetical protein
MFRRALTATIDLSCIDRIIQGIEDDQPRFDKLCEKMAKRKQDDDDKLCCVCYECEADQPLKCSHKLCPTCYDKLTQCPLCREQFKEPVDEREAWTRAFLADLERVQRLMDESDEWFLRPLDASISYLQGDSHCFYICLRNPTITQRIQQWLSNRGIAHDSREGGTRVVITIRDIDDATDLMKYMVEIDQRFELTLHDGMHSVNVINQDNGRFKAKFTTLRHAWNLNRYIGVRRCRYCGSGHQHSVIDIPCLFELMTFLTLPIQIQVHEPH